MSGQPRRLSAGGRIDRTRPLAFEFDGVAYEGFAGDTLASALLANGVDVVARGIYSGRPRGVYGSGADEPNAFVQVEAGGGLAPEPMVRATQLELVDGLRARSSAGRGRLPDRAAADADHARFDKRAVHADVLVVGGGPAGLETALAAGRTGVRVMLVDEQAELGGTLLDRPDDGRLAALVGELRGLPDVRLLPRTTALGLYDHGYAIAAERRPSAVTEGRLWHVRAGRVVLATGAHERPIVFEGNDLPGVMLASAAARYATRYGVRPGERAVVFTTNDAGLEAARRLEVAGVAIDDVVDTREGRVVERAHGEGRLEAVTIATEGRADRTLVWCDLLLVSGGWTPAAQLWTHTGGTLRFDDALAAFVPDRPNGPIEAVGAAAGRFDPVPHVRPRPARHTWWVRADDADPTRMFVDLARDATVADIERALGAGLRSVEHIKRYTTIGTAADQGRTSGLVASAIAAEVMGAPLSETGVTTARPPYAPASFALLAGRDRGELHDPVRTTAIHPWHVEHGAVFEDVGQWKRPRYFPNDGETMDDAVLRECEAARTGVAVMDASTLGKIDLQGPDAGAFLDRIYTNRFSNLAVGSCRYGVMCRADGMVFDDGVTSRLAEDRFHMTTTTGNAAAVLDHLEEWLQTEWPELRVRCTSVTEQWATVAVVGPRSRDVLGALAPELDVSGEAFPFMTWRDATVGGIPARVFRISFSGELAYEVNVGWSRGLELWERVMAAGAPFGITPYGTETMHVLRAEKGYPIVGQETDGTVTPQDLGMDWIVSTRKPFIGSRSHRRPDTRRPDRKQLVSLLPVDPDELLPEGAQLVDDAAHPVPVPMVGHVTSSYRSAALGRTFALALVKRGRERIGEHVFAPLADRVVEAVIAPSVLFDPENARRDGEPEAVT